MRYLPFIVLFVALAPISLVAFYIAAKPSRYSRNLHCESIVSTRAFEICSSLEKFQEYGFFGHAIPAPGYKVSFDTIRNAWCELDIGQSDVPILREMSNLSEWQIASLKISQIRDGRIASGADDLLRLYYQVNNLDQEDKNSIFNPTNPSYILRDGCTDN